MRIIASGALVDRLHFGLHAGSTATRGPIEKYRTGPCIAGHILKARDTDTIAIGGTPVITPGMLRKGGRIAIRLSPSTLQATLQ